MTGRSPSFLPLGAAFFCLLGARTSLASDHACASLSVRADDAVAARFPDLSGRVHEAFAARTDVERCAEVSLASRGSRLTLRVRLPDGRVAAREVAQEAEVLPTLEALLLLPDEREPEQTTAALAAEPEPAPITPIRNVSPELDAPAPPRQNRESAVRIELSLATGARIGNGQGSLGLGVTSLLDVSRWLVGFEGRADRYQDSSGGLTSAALELGVVVGRRFLFTTTSLDLTAGLAAAAQGTVTEETAPPPPAPRIRNSETSTVPRGLLGARLTFGARSTLRTFVGVEGAFGPVRSPSHVFLEEPPAIPPWTAGLVIGGTVGTL